MLLGSIDLVESLCTFPFRQSPPLGLGGFAAFVYEYVQTECFLSVAVVETKCARMAMRRFSAGAVNNLQIGGALTRIIYNGVLLSRF